VISLLFIVISALLFVGSIWAAIEEGVASKSIPWKIVGCSLFSLCSLLFWLLI
jgi:hypothetical protein